MQKRDAPSQETLVDWSTSVRNDELFSRPSLSVCAPSFVSPLQPRFSVSIDADTDYMHSTEYATTITFTVSHIFIVKCPSQRHSTFGLLQSSIVC